MSNYDFEGNVHKMWDSWMSSISNTIPFNAATLSVFAAIGLFKKNFVLSDFQFYVLLVFLLLLLFSLLIAFITKASGEFIMGYHLTGGVDTFKKSLEDRKMGAEDMMVYRCLNPIPKRHYTVAKKGPYILGASMLLQWTALAVLVAALLKNSGNV